MNKFMIKSDELAEMFRAQSELNDIYSGVFWRKTISMGDFKFAMLDEVSEFMRETEATWKWYKHPSKQSNNHQNAIFEFIDVIHFALSLVLYRHDVSSICDLVKSGNVYEPTDYVEVDDMNNLFVKAMTNFLKMVDNDMRAQMVSALINFIQVGGMMLKLEPGDIRKAYEMKYKRNLARVAGGVLTGNYDKTTEEALSL